MRQGHMLTGVTACAPRPAVVICHRGLPGQVSSLSSCAACSCLQRVLPGLSLIRDIAARSQNHRIQDNGGNSTRATDGRPPYASAAAHEGVDVQNVPRWCRSPRERSRQFDHFPLPKAKRGQLLVKTRAVGLNAIDWKLQEGQMRPFLPPKLPYIPCTDVAGITEFVQTGVYDSAVTDPVMGWTTLQRGGGLAEYAVLDEKHSARIPPEVAMHDASCLVSAGCAALQALQDKGGLRYDGSFCKTRRVMILGAAGGVGHYAIQIAKIGGAQVTAVTSSANAGFVRQLGADDVIAYQNTESLEFSQTREGLYDIVLDCSTSGISFSKVRFLLNDKVRAMHQGHVDLHDLILIRIIVYLLRPYTPLLTDSVHHLTLWP
eukprot:SM000011S19094  [mRNA]  locus=s11:837826:840139:- [translate_table: standard]